MQRIYDRPETLQILFGIDRKLQNEHGMGFDELFGGCLTFDRENGYFCTPKDSVIFLWTGAGGDHFVFSTKGDSLESLEHAPILFVQPMDSDHPVKKVANHLKDFIGLFVQLKEIYVLERFSSYQSEEEFKQDYEKNYVEDINEREEELSILINALLKEVDVPPISNVFQYITNLNNKE
ncbi:hypothetical protein ACFQZE_09585 [Paenibacillus sp. GCM10027627]|uniref:hypothetical protein n=1 Tax=unclassified Paenibacillus TaxID=185978 RepID=UPI003642A649